MLACVLHKPNAERYIEAYSDLSIQGEKGPRGNPGPQGYPGDKVIDVFSVPQYYTGIYDFLKAVIFISIIFKSGRCYLKLL